MIPMFLTVSKNVMNCRFSGSTTLCYGEGYLDRRKRSISITEIFQR